MSNFLPTNLTGLNSNPLAGINTSNLGLYNTNNSLYSGSNFDTLLSNGAFQQGLDVNSVSSGVSPQNMAILTEGANSLTHKIFNKISPLPQSYPNTSPYSSSLLPPGMSMLSLLGAITSNTIPLIKTKGALGSLFQSIPQFFQVITGGLGAIQAFNQIQAMRPPENKMSEPVLSDLQYDHEISEQFDG